MNKYLVIFHDAQDDTPAGREELKLRMSDSLKVSAKAVEGIFESLPVIIRRDLEKSVAEKYARSLEQLGAVAEVIQQVDDTLKPDEAPPLEAEQPLSTPSAPGEDYSLSLPESEPESDPDSDPDREDDLSKLEAMLDDALGSSEVVAESENDTLDLAALTAAAVNAPSAPQPGKPAPEPPEQDFSGLSLSFDEDEAPAVKRPTVILDMLGEDAPAGTPPVDAQNVAPPPPAEPHPADPALEAPAAEHDSGEPTPSEPQEPPMPESAYSSPYRAQSAFSAPVSPTDAPILEEIPPPRRRMSRGAQMSIAGMCLFLVCALAFARDTVFELFAPRQPRMQVSFDVDRLLKEQNSILGLNQAELDSGTPQISGQWSGETSLPEASSRMRITELDGVMQLVSLDVTTPEPAKLTDAELVAGKPLPVWLRKFEAVNLKLLPSSLESPNAPLRFIGNGRAYLQDGKGTDRQLAEVEISVARPSQGDTVRDAAWVIRRSLAEGAPPEQNTLSRLGAKDFRVYFRGTTQVTRQAPAASKPARVSHASAKK